MRIIGFGGEKERVRESLGKRGGIVKRKRERDAEKRGKPNASLFNTECLLPNPYLFHVLV